MERVDGWLSKRAQEAFPDAVVMLLPDGEYVFRRAGVEVALGTQFRMARQGLDALVRAERAKGVQR